MLRRIRLLLASLCFAGLCLLFADVSGLLQSRLAFLAEVQFVPALLSGSLLLVGILCLLTLLCGRVYCSVICPLGIMQDIIRSFNRKGRFRFSPGRTFLRIAALTAFTGAFAAGIPMFFTLMEPYSAFGRIASALLGPLWTAGNNTLALAAEHIGSLAIAPAPLWQKGTSVLIVAALTLALIGYLAWRSGRIWCNTLCPVGALLGGLSRFSWLRPRIDADKCVDCGRCASRCKATCIDVEHHTVNASRCVSCFNCLSACRKGALSYGPAILRQTRSQSEGAEDGAAKRNPSAPSRRALLFALTTAIASVPHIASADKGTLIPALTRKLRPSRTVPVTPPGSHGLRHFTSRCTGCQLCVSACPHQALRGFDAGLGMLQPSLSFEHGYCRVNCVSCSAVCPTGAIQPITPSRKSALQIGHAVVWPERCIITTDGVPCTACSRNCPAGAIRLTGDRRMPAVDTERCIGCGACEYYCPARPYAAIQVEGNVVHRSV